MTTPPLRLGLLTEGPAIPWWIAPALDTVERRGIAQVALVTWIEPVASDQTDAVPGHRQRWQHLLYRLFTAFDTRRDFGTADPPTRVFADGALAIPIAPPAPKEEHRLPSAAALDRIRAARLDVLLVVAHHAPPDALRDIAAHGTWQVIYGSDAPNTRDFPGFWEVMDGLPATAIQLRCLVPNTASGAVLASAIHPTIPFSPARSRQALLANSGRVVARALERLHRDGTALLPSDSPPPPAQHRSPTNGTMLRALPRLLARYLRHRFRIRRSREQWHLAWRWHTDRDNDAPLPDVDRYRTIPPPPDRFWADPFVAVDGERHWVFFEEQRFDRPNGTLMVVEMTPEGPAGVPQPILEEPWHLSFPGVFKVGAQWYLVPESADAEAIFLYEAVAFPHTWRRRTVLLMERAADPILLRHEDHWYLFCSPYRLGENPSQELHLYVADSLEGPYAPHPMNPLTMDGARARMAGHLYRRGSDLIRPAQSCIPNYGAAVALQRVTVLTPTIYREEPLGVITPPGHDQRMIGLHTFNAAGHLSMLDLLSRRRI